MYFDRVPKIKREVTPRRFLAALRAVERDRQSVPLFPELMRYSSPEERLKSQDEGFADMEKYWRNERAKTWRKLLSLPADIAAQIREHWQRRIYPGSAEYLASVIHSFLNGHLNIKEYHASVERARMLGAARREKCDICGEENAFMWTRYTGTQFICLKHW